MTKRKNNLQQSVEVPNNKEKKVARNKTPRKRLGANETPVDLLDPELIPWIKVIKPSRASLTYERME